MIGELLGADVDEPEHPFEQLFGRRSRQRALRRAGVAQQVDERGVAQGLTAEGDAAALVHRAGAGRDITDQARLADAGLPDDGQRATAASPGPLEGVLKCGDGPRPSNERCVGGGQHRHPTMLADLRGVRRGARDQGRKTPKKASDRRRRNA